MSLKMHHLRSKLSKQFRIFIAIGIFNTVLDIALYVTLHDGAGVPIVLANIISTSVALCGSYLLNSRFTFNSKELWNRQRITRFLGITLTGLWILQPLIIIGVITALASTFNESQTSIIAKLLATAVTTVWNYVWYKRVVFDTK